MIDLPTPVSPDRLLNILIQTGHGLAAAHSKGIVHRDMKPENIYVTRKKDGTDLPKLLDFGIAKVSQGEGENHLTRTGTIFGTPFYMAPEQALGQTVDHRADIYAMGVIMYEVFCGVVPFEGESFMGILTQHITAEPKPPAVAAAENGKQLLPGIEEVILRAMKKDPNERYQKMDELVQALVPIYRSLAGAGMSTYMEAHPAPASAAMAAVPPPSGGYPGHQTGNPYPASGPQPAGAVTPMPTHRDEHSQPNIPAAAMGSAPYAAYPGASSVGVPPHRKSKAGVIAMIIVVLTVIGGGAAFFLLGSEDGDKEAVAASDDTTDDTTDDATDPKNGSDPNGAGNSSNGSDSNHAVTGADAGAATDPNSAGDPNNGSDLNNDGSPDAGTVVQPPVKKVTVLLNSKPPGAKAYRDGKYLGRTPLIVKVNPAEPVDIVLKAPRRKDEKVTIDGSKSKVTSSLERKHGSNSHHNGNHDNSDNNNDNHDNGSNDKPPPPVDPCKKNPNLPECMLE
jgi:serine/threonine-protein kinase